MRKKSLVGLLGLLFAVFSMMLFGYPLVKAVEQEVTLKSSDNLIVTTNVPFQSTISIQIMEDMVGFQFRFLYNSEKFELNDVSKVTSLPSNLVANTNLLGEITLNYSDANNPLNGDQDLFTFTFTPKESLAIGMHTLFWMDDGYDQEIAVLEGVDNIGAIRSIYSDFSPVQHGLYGDVNADGNVSIQDVGLIQLYLAGLVSLNESQKQLADVNMDGQISIQDVGLIQLYLAGFRTYLGPNPDLDIFTITFEVDGGTHIEPIDAQKHQSLTPPPPPTKSNYIFGGWYTGSTFETVFDFNTLIVQNMTLYALWIEQGDLTIPQIKTLEKGTSVSLEVTVSYISRNGFFVSDGWGDIFVYSINAPLNFGPGAILQIDGIVDTYFGTPQIQYPSWVVLQEAPATGYDYSNVTPATIEELIVFPTGDLHHYGRFFIIEGYVTESYYKNNLFISDLAIMSSTTGEKIPIIAQTNDQTIFELYDHIDEYVRLVVIVYDYHSTHVLWRFLAVQGTIEVVEEQVITDVEKVARTIEELERDFPLNMEVYDNLHLYTFNHFVGVEIQWTIMPSGIIAEDGTYTSPSVETPVTLTATVTAGVEQGTYSVTVNAKPSSTMTIAEVKQLPLFSMVEIRGVVTAEVGNHAYIQDETGAIYLFNGLSDFYRDVLVPGYEVIVRGETTIFNGLHQLYNLTSVVVLQHGVDLPDAVLLHDVLGTDLLTYQSQRTNITGFTIKSLPALPISHTGGYSIVLTNDIYDIVVYVHSEATLTKSVRDTINQVVNTLMVGEKMDIVGATLGWFHTVQITLSDASQIRLESYTNEMKVAMTQQQLEYLFASLTVVEADMILPTLNHLEGVQISWSSTPEGIIAADGTYSAPEEDTYVTLTATIIAGDEEGAFSIVVLAKSKVVVTSLIYTLDFEDVNPPITTYSLDPLVRSFHEKEWSILQSLVTNTDYRDRKIGDFAIRMRANVDITPVLEMLFDLENVAYFTMYASHYSWHSESRYSVYKSIDSGDSWIPIALDVNPVTYGVSEPIEDISASLVRYDLNEPGKVRIKIEVTNDIITNKSINLDHLQFYREAEPLNQVNIFSVNDTHGVFYTDSAFPGFEKAQTLIHQLESMEGSFIKVAVGDIFQGSYESNIHYGRPLVDVLNAMNFDAFVIGNHEFDWGIDKIAQYADGNLENGEANFPFLASNIVYTATGEKLPWTQDYVIVENNGYKVGIIGSIGYGQENSIATEMVAGYTFLNPVPIAAMLAASLRVDHGCDVVVVATHEYNSGTNSAYAALEGNQRIDAILCAHTHQQIAHFEMRNDEYLVPIMQSYGKNQSVGTIRIEMDALRQASSASIHHYDLWAYANDPNILDVIAWYADDIAAGNAILGYTVEYLYASRIGREMSNAMVEAFDADIAFINTGGVRGQIGVGNILLKHIYEVFPFNNTVVLVTMSGTDILAFYQQNGAFMYFNESFDPQTIVASEQYDVATIDFVFYRERYADLFTKYIEVNTEILMRDVFANYIESFYAISG